MLKRHLVTPVAILLLLILMSVTLTPVKGFIYVHIWRVKFSGSILVAGNQSYPISTRWDYIDNMTWQTCELLSLDIAHNNDTIMPMELSTDIDGNPELILNLTTPLQQNDIFSWQEEWRFTVSEQRSSLPHIGVEHAGSVSEIEDILGIDDYQWYTQATNLWKTSNQTLLNLAINIRDSLPQEQRENVLALAYAAIEWIHGNINRTTSLVEPQYPEELLVSQIGDCDDQSNLLIVLLRIFGIPAYLMTGHWFQEGASTSEYLWGSVSEDAYLYVNWQNVLGHGWSMVYIPPWGWLPFDLNAENLNLDPANAYTESLYAQGIPMVTLWSCLASDYIGEQRSQRQDIFEYSLHFYDYEEWITLGSIPILDLPYFATNAATLIALTITLILLSCFVGIGMRRQTREENNQ